MINEQLYHTSQSRIRLFSMTAMSIQYDKYLRVCVIIQYSSSDQEDEPHQAFFQIARKMLPNSSLPSLEEKFRAHRDREENLIEEDTLEAEKSARFGRCSRNRKFPDFAALLLGPEFHESRDDSDDSKCTLSTESITECQRRANAGNRKKFEGRNVNKYANTKTDWTVRPLPHSVLSKLDSIRSITISVPTAKGGGHSVTLCERTLDRIRGTFRSGNAEDDEKQILSWLDDNVIDGFTSLINRRSQESCKNGDPKHRQSKDISNRRRVRTFIFSSQFYTIWKRTQNGGYDSIKRWRRKVPEYNSVGIFMFPAFVNFNHWVLACNWCWWWAAHVLWPADAAWHLGCDAMR